MIMDYHNFGFLLIKEMEKNVFLVVGYMNMGRYHMVWRSRRKK